MRPALLTIGTLALLVASYQQNSTAICGGLVLFAIGIAITLWMPHRTATERILQQIEAEHGLQQIEKELGFRPYSQTELKQMEEQERYTHNVNHQSLAFWVGSNTWIDYDGVVRDTFTGQVIRHPKKEKNE